jgi:exonuclease SbcC
VLLDDLCGGEEVWILKALRLAMTLISREKSGKRYESIFCDEEDGALSVQNAKRFIYLYKSLMEIGDIDTCFYISHKPEAVALANHVLSFGDGGITIN